MMKFLSKLSEQTSNSLLNITIVLSILGSFVEMVGIMWDASAHVIRTPETFWSVQHIVVYSGMGMFVSSAILGTLLYTKNLINKRFKRGIIILIAGACIPVISGYVDWNDHIKHGYEAPAVSMSHIGIEYGPAIAATGGFLISKEKKDQKLRKLVPISILTIILSSQVGPFNLALTFFAPMICLDVHYLFYHGCIIQ
ncbi:MAG TPA: hypothetical protein VJ792_02810 [Candidatus Nitrosotalea sp.]|nr:hypothetical protein [Candidatus Nitrosotalea sp.]